MKYLIIVLNIIFLCGTSLPGTMYLHSNLKKSFSRNRYHFKYTNYHLFNVNYKTFNKIYSLDSETKKF